MARNNGVHFAYGEYLAFVDGDDYVSNDAYEKMYTKIKQTGSDIVSGNVIRFLSTGMFPSWLYQTAIQGCKDKTHVTKNPELMYDTIACNKLFKRTFWDQYQFTFPEGITYEDIPVIIPAHYFTTSTDIISDIVYYWRIREGNDLSITQRNHEIQILKDRLFGLQAIEDFFNKYAVPTELKEIHYFKTLSLDLPVHIQQLPFIDEEYIHELQVGVTAYLQNVSDGIFEKLPLVSQIKYNLLKENNIEKLIYFIENEQYFNEKQYQMKIERQGKVAK